MVSMRNKKNYPSIIIKYPFLSRALDRKEYLMIIRDFFLILHKNML